MRCAAVVCDAAIPRCSASPLNARSSVCIVPIMSSKTPTPGFFDHDALEDSWFDLPRVDIVAASAPEDETEELEDSWFDGPKPR